MSAVQPSESYPKGASTLVVEKPGFLSTLQDLGRPGLAHLGISASGAADALALRLGNIIVGNQEGAAAVELTLVGGTYAFLEDTTIALTGADFGAVLVRQFAGAARESTFPPWRAATVRRGDSLVLGAARRGARGYLCVRGGFDVPPVLGSASTHLLTGLGGLGRPLRAGDRLRAHKGHGDSGGTPASLDAALDAPLDTGHDASHDAALGAPLDAPWLEEQYASRPLRITAGPQADWFDPAARAKFVDSDYEVLEQSNRMGLRLAGPPLERGKPGDLLTEGVSLGAVQVPENGQPIILFVEHQTTGGYPKIANVCSVDMHRLGQLRPRDRLRFQWVDLETAHRLFLEREAYLARERQP